MPVRTTINPVCVSTTPSVTLALSMLTNSLITPPVMIAERSMVICRGCYQYIYRSFDFGILFLVHFSNTPALRLIGYMSRERAISKLY